MIQTDLNETKEKKRERDEKAKRERQNRTIALRTPSRVLSWRFLIFDKNRDRKKEQI